MKAQEGNKEQWCKVVVVAGEGLPHKQKHTTMHNLKLCFCLSVQSAQNSLKTKAQHTQCSA